MDRRNMYIERDIENNQLYVSFSDGVAEGAAAETAEVSPGIYFDLDAEGKLVGIDIVNTKEVIGAAAAELALSGEIVGVKEAAQLVGKDRGNFLRDLASRPDFPKPVARVASGQLWLSKDIERYLERRRAAPEKDGGSAQAARKGVLQEESSLTGTKFQIYQDRKGEYRWRLRARNGEIIADSNESYSSKASCEHGIDLVKQQAASAAVETAT
jgi:uncharacterized protein YegP (UPF0339 family)/uncharacterized protein YuzE